MTQQTRPLGGSCPRCGWLVPDRPRFCPGCGVELSYGPILETPATMATPSPERGDEPYLPWDEQPDARAFGSPRDAGEGWAAEHSGSGQPEHVRPRSAHQGAPTDPQVPSHVDNRTYAAPPGHDEREARDRSHALYVAAAMVLCFGLVAGGVFWLLGLTAGGPTRSVPVGSLAGSSAGTPSGETPSRGGGTPAESPTDSVPVAGPGQKLCAQTAHPDGEMRFSLAGNGNTSCEFAEAVRAAWLAAADRSVPLSATSPVTGKTYSVRCSEADTTVRCEGIDGNNILVILHA